MFTDTTRFFFFFFSGHLKQTTLSPFSEKFFWFGETRPLLNRLPPTSPFPSHTGGCAPLLSLVRLFATPWPVARQAPLSIEFSRQGYWSGLPFPSPGDLPDPGIEPSSLVSPALAGGFFTTSASG